MHAVGASTSVVLKESQHRKQAGASLGRPVLAYMKDTTSGDLAKLQTELGHEHANAVHPQAFFSL